MSVLPDGLYDLLLDERLRAIALELQDSGHADVEKLTTVPRDAAALRKCSPGYSQNCSKRPPTRRDGAREQRELELINGLIGQLRRSASVATGPPRCWRCAQSTAATPDGAAAHRCAGALAVHRRALIHRFSPNCAPNSRRPIASTLWSASSPWSGLRKLLDVLESVTAIGGDGEPRTRLRVITPLHGATEARAVEAALAACRR